MKYKRQALERVEHVQNRIMGLEGSISRQAALGEIQANIQNLKDLVENLREILNIENDEMNY